MSKDRLPYDEVKREIENAKSITILSHLNPDADALGTALGIYALLKQDKSKKVEIVNASTVLPKYLDFLPNFKKIKHHMDYVDSLIISCDCGSIDRLGFDLKGRNIINIDHHESNTRYGIINVVLPSFASSSQVAFKLFCEHHKIDEDTATCFYTALLSDTRYFTTSSMNEEVFSVAKALVKLGANSHEIAKHFTEEKSLSSLRTLSKALASLELVNNAQIAIMKLTKEDIVATGATTPDMESVVDYGKSLITVKIAIFAMEVQEGIRISLRSKGIDVSKIAITFGGGGHKVAAGFTLKNHTLEKGIEAIVDEIKRIRLLEARH